MANPVKDDSNLAMLSQHVEGFLNATETARAASENDRDYRDHKQWTTEEADILQGREQQPIVINRIAPKVDALLGMEAQRRTAPKALPRTFAEEKGADAATDALRYVLDNNDFQDSISPEVFDNMIVEGYGGVIVEMTKKGKKREVLITEIPWDRIFYDPHSRRKDFKDARYMGIQMWMDKEDAKIDFPDMSKAIDSLFEEQTDTDGTTFGDRPSNFWVDSSRKRVRIAQEYFLKGGVWHQAFFTKGFMLKDPVPSVFKDENGDPANPIELHSIYVDRDNNRYGSVRAWIGAQDEINHRRSKALYMLSARSVVADRGAVTDRDDALAELRKAQGYLEVNTNARFEIHDNNDMGQAQFALLEEAKSEIDTIGINPELSGRGPQDASGRALIARQQGGVTEILHVLNQHTSWKKRVYRQVWDRVVQFWTEERWLRVTDDPNSMRFIGLNIPVNALEDRIMQRTGLDIQQVKQRFGEQIQAAIEMDPQAGEIVRTVNNVKELDVDILIEESPDTATIQQEQFEVISGLAERYGPQEVPFEAMLRLSSMNKKDEVLNLIQGDEQQKQAQAEEAAAMQELAVNKEIAETELKEASAIDKLASAEQREADTALKTAQMLQEQEDSPESQIDRLQAEGERLKNEGLQLQKEIKEAELAKVRAETRRMEAESEAQRIENMFVEKQLNSGVN